MPPSWPGAFTVTGKMTSGGVNFHPQNQVSDADLRLSNDGTHYELLIVTNRFVAGVPNPKPAQFTYTQCPVRGNLLTGWSNNLDADGQPIIQMSVIPKGINEEGVDTPSKIKHPTLGLDILAYQSRPGVRPVGAKGHISCIQAATSLSYPTGASCKWCQKNTRILLRPSRPWHAGYSYINEGVLTYAGGVLEASILYRQATNEFYLFFQGYTSTGGADAHKLGRAIDATGSGLSPYTLNPVDPVFNRLVGTPSVWGNRDIGMECQVTLDPDGNTLWCTWVGDIEGGEHAAGVGLSRSDDWGLTWVNSPDNPILDVTDAGIPFTAINDRLASPKMIPSFDGSKWLLSFAFKGANKIGGEFGGIYLAQATRTP